MEPIGLHRKGEVELEQILEYFSTLPEYHKAGGIACFIGIVREDPVHGSEDQVTHLEYEAYEEAALRMMEQIRQDMKQKPGIIEVSIHHVIDKVNIGEPSLFVAVLGKHRQEVFSVLPETVDRIKKEVTIWKKEFTKEQAYWVSSEEH
jgi:molybdopterin synthase catalytic subunit